MADIPDDPESLTVPTLTSILSEHGIALPTKKEKKSFYVDLYTKELLNKVSVVATFEKLAIYFNFITNSLFRKYLRILQDFSRIFSLISPPF